MRTYQVNEKYMACKGLGGWLIIGRGLGRPAEGWLRLRGSMLEVMRRIADRQLRK